MENEGLSSDIETGGFSLIELLLDADPIVKAVLIILLIASIWSWAIIVEKHFSLGKLRKQAREFEDGFWSGGSDFDPRPGQSNSDAASRVFGAAHREWADSRRMQYTPEGVSSMVERAERGMRAAVDREVGKASGGLGVLASVASASPFIGLFGTVWGIMNAFLTIDAKGDTSLGVVAGPIAEALFATGLGLVAAIPAVIFYNKYSGDLNKFADQLDTFSQDILVRLSRRASEKAGQ